jgi:ABC-type antimicrobial peptide transport system permease subunit
MLYQIERLDAPTKYYEPSETMIVRGTSASLAAAAVNDAASAVIPQADLLRVQTFGDLVKQDLSRELMLVGLSASFALLALLLTVLGLYGLLMREVAMRTREIGIRVALGATRREILLAIGRGTFNEVAIGLAAGIFLTWFVDRAARQLLQLHSHPGVSGFFSSSATVLIMAAMAAVVPARRAARVDPVEALRAE